MHTNTAAMMPAPRPASRDNRAPVTSAEKMRLSRARAQARMFEEAAAVAIYGDGNMADIWRDDAMTHFRNMARELGLTVAEADNG